MKDNNNRCLIKILCFNNNSNKYLINQINSMNKCNNSNHSHHIMRHNQVKKLLKLKLNNKQK